MSGKKNDNLRRLDAQHHIDRTGGYDSCAYTGRPWPCAVHLTLHPDEAEKYRRELEES